MVYLACFILHRNKFKFHFQITKCLRLKKKKKNFTCYCFILFIYLFFLCLCQIMRIGTSDPSWSHLKKDKTKIFFIMFYFQFRRLFSYSDNLYWWDFYFPYKYNDWLIFFKWHVNPARVILCLEVWKLCSLYFHIYVFVLSFLKSLFLFAHGPIKYK